MVSVTTFIDDRQENCPNKKDADALLSTDLWHSTNMRYIYEMSDGILDRDLGNTIWVLHTTYVHHVQVPVQVCILVQSCQLMWDMLRKLNTIYLGSSSHTILTQTNGTIQDVSYLHCYYTHKLYSSHREYQSFPTCL